MAAAAPINPDEAPVIAVVPAVVQGGAAALAAAAAPAAAAVVGPQAAVADAAPEMPSLGRRLKSAVAQEAGDLLASVAAAGLKDALEESELLDMERLLSVSGRGLMAAVGSAAYNQSFAALVGLVTASAAWASADAGVKFHVESLLHNVIEMAKEARPASLLMRRDVAGARVAIASNNGGADAPGGGGGDQGSGEESKPKELTREEWRAKISPIIEAQLGSLPDITMWPFVGDLLTLCIGLSGVRPRLAQLSELQLPRLGLDSTAGAHAATAKNKVFHHDRGYLAEEELDLLEDFFSAVAWAAAQVVPESKDTVESWWILAECDHESGVSLDNTGRQVAVVGQFNKIMDVPTMARRQAHSFDMGGPEAATLVDDIIGTLSRGVCNERRTLTNISLQLCREMPKLAREAMHSSGTHARQAGRAVPGPERARRRQPRRAARRRP